MTKRLSISRRIVIGAAAVLLALVGFFAAAASASYAEPMRFSLTDATYPTSLSAGESFSLQGTVSAAGSGTITRVEVGVLDSAGERYIDGFYFNKTGINASTYPLTEADSALKFGALPEGRYLYRVTAYDAAGAQQLLNVPFEVTSAGKWVKEGGEWHYTIGGVRQTNTWARDSIGWCRLDKNGCIIKSKWIQDGSEWYYLKPNGYMAANEWAKDSKGWCWMNGAGRITKAKWIQDKDGEWYYLKDDGYMAANEWAEDSKGRCRLNASGRVIKDKWVKAEDGEWYYLNADGYMAANAWAQDSKGHCRLGEDGRMVRNRWFEDEDGEWYFLKADGYRAEKYWKKDSKGWCRLGEDGKIVREAWIKDGGEWYYLKADGYMAANEWAQDSIGKCWLGGSGKIQKNQWIWYNDQWYYLKSNGYMAADEWAADSAGKCWMTAEGIMLKESWIKVDGQWYYLKANGYMAVNAWAEDSVGWCWLRGDGTILRNEWAGSADKWYYMGANGYISEGPVGFETYLTRAGFPAAYKPGLRTLHAAHPKWIFYMDNTGLSWSTVLSAEKKLGVNLVEPTSPASYINQTYKERTFDGRWKQASDAAIKYYLDPRNFLTETGVFQFLDQRTAWNPGTKAQVTKLVTSNPCFMNTPTYINSLVSAGRSSGVNAAVLTAMVIQEQGWQGGSSLISGTNSSYPGVYNHFNIGAFAWGGRNSVTNGLRYASGAEGPYTYGRPWNSIEKSLAGGVLFYKEQYIDAKQYTYYTKKYDVMDGEADTSHQYMTNTEGAYAEGAIVKNAFRGDSGVLVFRIPVYSGMPTKACPAP